MRILLICLIATTGASATVIDDEWIADLLTPSPEQWWHVEEYSGEPFAGRYAAKILIDDAQALLLRSKTIEYAVADDAVMLENKVVEAYNAASAFEAKFGIVTPEALVRFGLDLAWLDNLEFGGELARARAARFAAALAAYSLVKERPVFIAWLAATAQDSGYPPQERTPEEDQILPGDQLIYLRISGSLQSVIRKIARLIDTHGGLDEIRDMLIVPDAGPASTEVLEAIERALETGDAERP